MVLCQITVICYDGAVNSGRTEMEEGVEKQDVLKKSEYGQKQNSAAALSFVSRETGMSHHEEMTGSEHTYQEMMTSLPLERQMETFLRALRVTLLAE